MNFMQVLKIQSDWGGGRMVTADSQVRITSVDQISPVVAILRDGVQVGIGVVKGERREDGSDYDHGHTQNWKAFDLNITLPPSGVGVNVRELDRQGFSVAVTMIE